ncbi:hypothetical protein [Riemerella anatipestifer]|uniref:Uncharacterized protein n=1 Tax=Riemerella anatipestifer RA-CH-1 TaxID=1228997 RepID=J9R7N8_RIEAN|nr:hypothetical protein [Riemerella anatipestifer]AFR36228.1 hypothetical protein B739_1636 [Riemerella anatipestifer RA-CH-1]MCO7331998.1 hypothetical protein [Riemerella anatipestifer]MCO7350885.1 hypothetical protein [Riemerella anatipestifer]MCU7582376.1 hypothetical protein [Riemerella anatipestifer]MSN88239.1 hypothetical protein [Riemerella anatipestifer]
MQDKFITNTGVEIPLDYTNFTYVEENPRFKDTFWTNYTLPIDISYSRDFLSSFGQYSSLNNIGLKRYHEGIHQFEGRLRKGKLEVLEFKKEMLKIQIDSGFETLPNFEKPLSELPLLNIAVDDIYNHANDIVTKKYPETVYNFPKLYTDEYNLQDEAYKYFDSFINNRNNHEGRTTKGFSRNRLENEVDVYNKNILHPLPYLLYVLTVGFSDAGFRLEGEILEDEYLKYRLIWSGKPYHTSGDQKEHKLNVYSEEYLNQSVNGNLYFGEWQKEILIDAPGKYNIKGHFQTQIGLNDGGGRVELNIPTLNFSQSFSVNQSSDIQQSIDISEEQAKEGVRVIFKFKGAMGYSKVADDGVNLGLAQLQILPKRMHTKEGVPIPYIYNDNRVNLSKAVPEMNFGELVTAIKNLRNYDLEFEGNRAIMNKIKIDKYKEPEDFRMFEVENPTRFFNDKVSFNITFPDEESVATKNIYFDETGYRLNYRSVPETATEININVISLPFTMFRSVFTAKAINSNALMLVYYDGLDNNGNNHAQNKKGLMDEELAKYLEPWFMNRLTNFRYKWTFICEKNKIRNFNIRSAIFAYNRKHWIKSWTKKSLTSNLYSIEIETETF